MPSRMSWRSHSITKDLSRSDSMLVKMRRMQRREEQSTNWGGCSGRPTVDTQCISGDRLSISRPKRWLKSQWSKQMLFKTSIWKRWDRLRYKTVIGHWRPQTRVRRLDGSSHGRELPNGWSISVSLSKLSRKQWTHMQPRDSWWNGGVELRQQ